MSTADTFPVTSNAPYNAGTFSNSVTVINEDLNNTVYLSDAPTTQQGFPLDPGATLTWPPGKTLYLYITDTTKPVNVLVSDIAGLYTSPKAIASQILNGGLANAIAQQIALTGVPTIDQPTVLYDSGDKAGGSSISSPTIDVSKYQSVTVIINERQPTGARPAQPGSGTTLVRQVQMTFYDSSVGLAGSPYARSYNCDYVGGGQTGSISTSFSQVAANLPVSGDRFQVTVTGTDSAIAGTVTNRIIIIGSYRSIPKSSIVIDNAYHANDTTISGDPLVGNLVCSLVNMTANQQVQSLPPVVRGPGVLSVYFDAPGANGAQLYLTDLATGAVLCYLKSTAPGFFTTQNAVFPSAPMLLTVNNLNAATQAVHYLVTFEYDN